MAKPKRAAGVSIASYYLTPAVRRQNREMKKAFKFKSETAFVMDTLEKRYKRFKANKRRKATAPK